MSYVPIITPGMLPQPTDTDHRDLITALKLLSGEACLRDARQAQVILVGLTESKHTDVVADARAIMETGLAQGWFEDTVPNYYILRDIAERSIAQHEKGASSQRQLVLVLIGGLTAFVLGIVFYFRQSGMEEPPWIMITLVAGLIVALFVAKMALKGKRL